MVDFKTLNRQKTKPFPHTHTHTHTHTHSCDTIPDCSYCQTLVVYCMQISVSSGESYVCVLREAARHNPCHHFDQPTSRQLHCISVTANVRIVNRHEPSRSPHSDRVGTPACGRCRWWSGTD
jgi:hypothetical protein